MIGWYAGNDAGAHRIREIPLCECGRACQDGRVPHTVVIVDDHPTFRRFARRLLEEAGFKVVGEASDGVSALGCIAELAPDAVLLDVMLPDMSGIEVAERLVSHSPSVRVMLISSRGADDLGIEPRTAAHWFVRKDELVIDVLDGMLGGRP